MNYAPVYDPIALTEYKEAIAWYFERSEMAADNFTKEVQDKIELICKDPSRYLMFFTKKEILKKNTINELRRYGKG